MLNKGRITIKENIRYLISYRVENNIKAQSMQIHAHLKQRGGSELGGGEVHMSVVG